MKLPLCRAMAIAACAAAIGLATIAAGRVNVQQSSGNGPLMLPPAPRETAAQQQQPFGGNIGDRMFNH